MKFRTSQERQAENVFSFDEEFGHPTGPLKVRELVTNDFSVCPFANVGDEGFSDEVRVSDGSQMFSPARNLASKSSNSPSLACRNRRIRAIHDSRSAVFDSNCFSVSASWLCKLCILVMSYKYV